MKSTYINALINESSPYLLQHAHNPVNWMPWNDETLAKAQAENKLLIISVGYAACHWCHVMEHESFEDEQVAHLMNEHFICIKVDREERPDVDQVYMNAAHLITGRGGWPLNALALPDGRPFYAGTYFPKNDWMHMLSHFVNLRAADPNAILTWADKITKGIQILDDVPKVETPHLWSSSDIDSLVSNLLADIDYVKGGQNRAPKFPMPTNWEFLLQYASQHDNKKAMQALIATLDNMALGGIYDQLGGGFARYSTDEDWRVPHFEKMLYDNAQLVSLYAHAFQLTKNPLYENIVRDTLTFVERELCSDGGAFYSSLDADTEGVEGKCYVWTQSEIEECLGDDADFFCNYYNVVRDGNWEHGLNVLYRIPSSANIQLDADEQELVDRCKSKLLKLRNARVQPGLDDKILTSWNALMLSGYIHAYRAFGDAHYLQMAINNAEFLLQNVIADDYSITRNYKNGKSTIPGLLDDYAFVISAFIDLYQATFEESYLHKAHSLTEYVIANFMDSESGMFFYTHQSHSTLIARQKELSDNVIPASNSEMAKNLFKLGRYYDNLSWIEMSETMLSAIKDNLHQHIYFNANWAQLALLLSQPTYDLAIVGEKALGLRAELDQNFLPHILLAGSITQSDLPLLKDKWKDGETDLYLCVDKVCGLPVKRIEDLVDLICNKKGAIR